MSQTDPFDALKPFEDVDPERAGTRQSPPNGQGRNLPVIDLAAGQLPETVGQAQAALRAGCPEIFDRGGQLVRAVRIAEPGALDGISRPIGALVLKPCEPDWLRLRLAGAATWRKYEARGKTWRPVDPPAEIAKIIIAAPEDGGCSTNYLVDLENAIIVDVEPTAPIRQAEAGAAQEMIERTRNRFGLYPEILAADTAYGSADMLGWLVEDEGIEPHIPVFDKSARKDGAYPATDFTYDHAADQYTCPGGKPLKPYWRNISKDRPEYGKDGFKRYFVRKQTAPPAR